MKITRARAPPFRHTATRALVGVNVRFLVETPTMARYESHPVFELPDDSTTIWRYMGFSKFISLLNSSALYFIVANRFEDAGKAPFQ